MVDPPINQSMRKVMLAWWNKWYDELPAYKVELPDPNEIITPATAATYGSRGIDRSRSSALSGEFMRRTNEFRYAHELYLSRLMEEVNAVDAEVARQDPDYQGSSE
jgi:hypothetical protein